MKRVFLLLTLLLGLVCACQEVVLEDDSEKTEDGTSGGGGTGGVSETDKERAVKICDLGETAEGDKVTVTGYIVGFVPSSSITATVFDATGAVASNIVLADNADELDSDLCAAVQLVQGTAVRAALNLSDHPDNLGRKVYITGTRSTYYKAPGLKSPTAWSWAESDNPDAPGDGKDETETPNIPSQPAISNEVATVLEGC